MRKTLDEVAATIRREHHASLPASPDRLEGARARGVPVPLLELHARFDGAALCPGDDFPAPDGRRFRFKMPPLAELQTVAQEGYAPDDSSMLDQLREWWGFLDCGDGDWIALTGPAEGFRVVDVFHETAGQPGYHKIVSPDLLTFFNALLDRGEVFWLDEDFVGLGWL